MSRAHFVFEGRGLHQALLGLGFALPLGLAACSGLIPPDPYQGTIDPTPSSTTGGVFDPVWATLTTSTSPPPTTPATASSPCMQPRSGFGGGTGAGSFDRVTWLYLGGLTRAQLDISNASDPTRALPPAVYTVSGCNAPEGRGEARDFDPRLDNYLRDKQYPVLAQGMMPAAAGAATEPTRISTYKPWHVVIPTTIGGSIVDRMGCNDIKGERSLLERAGWSRETKLFPESGPTDYDIQFPSRDDIRAGRAKFMDWPMVSVAVPIMGSTVAMQSCPFVLGNTTRPPAFPGDPQASFQFASQHWLRGLLAGYLDGGELPVTTDPAKCPALVTTVKDCSAMSPCSGTGEVCTAGKCVAPVPICPVYNDLYVASDEVPVPTATTESNPIPNAYVTLKDPMDMTKTRVAEIMAFFSAVPGQTGFSPVCRLKFFDKKKLTTCPMEPEAMLPRPLCTIAEIEAKGAVISTPRDYFVHCLFAKPPAR